ncbi:hypothetical protein GGI13_000026 [Coemansia sp. RSA 455]|nr:hypothetical protein GGI13_000026 [Coemansia sp. RSA 455]
MRLGFVGLCVAVLLSDALGQGVALTTNTPAPSSAPTGPTHAQTPPRVPTPDGDGDDGWRASLSLPCLQATHQTGVTIDRVWGAHRCRGIFFVPRPTVAAPTWAVGSHASWPVATSSIPPAWLIEEVQEEATPEVTPQDGWPTEAAPTPLATEAAPTPSPRRYIGTFWPREGGQGLLTTEGTLTRSSTRYVPTLWPWEAGQSPLPTEAATSPSTTDATPTARPTVTARLTQSTQEDDFYHPMIEVTSGLAVVVIGIGIAILAKVGADLQRQPTILPSNDDSGGDDDSSGSDGDGDAAPKGGAHPGELNPPPVPPVVERGDDPQENLNPPSLPLVVERGDDPQGDLDRPQLPPVVERGNEPQEEPSPPSLPPVVERGNEPQEEPNPPSLPPVVERGNEPQEEPSPPSLPPVVERGDNPQEEPNPPSLPPVVERGDDPQEDLDRPQQLPAVESEDQLEESDDQPVDVTPTRVTKQVPVAIEPLPIADTPTPASVDGQALVASIDEQVSSNSAPTQTPVDNPPDDPVLSGTTPIQEPEATKTGKTIDSSAASSAPTQPAVSSASDKGMEPECASANKASSSSSSSGTFAALEPVTQPEEPVEETGTTGQTPVIARPNLPVSGSFTFGTPTPPLFNMGSIGSSSKGKRLRDIAKPKSQLRSSSSSKVAASVPTQPATMPAPVATKTSKTVDDSAADSVPIQPVTPHADGNGTTRADMAAQAAGQDPITRAPKPAITEASKTVDSPAAAGAPVDSATPRASPCKKGKRGKGKKGKKSKKGKKGRGTVVAITTGQESLVATSIAEHHVVPAPSSVTTELESTPATTLQAPVVADTSNSNGAPANNDERMQVGTPLFSTGVRHEDLLVIAGSRPDETTGTDTVAKGAATPHVTGAMNVEEPADVKREAVVPAPNDDSDVEGEESGNDADFDMYGKGFSDEDDQNMENAEPTVDDQDMEDNGVQIVVYAQVLDPASVEARAESLGRPIRRLGRPRPATTATGTLPLNPEHPVAGAMPVFNSGNVQFGNDSSANTLSPSVANTVGQAVPGPLPDTSYIDIAALMQSFANTGAESNNLPANNSIGGSSLQFNVGNPSFDNAATGGNENFGTASGANTFQPNLVNAGITQQYGNADISEFLAKIGYGAEDNPAPEYDEEHRRFEGLLTSSSGLPVADQTQPHNQPLPYPLPAISAADTTGTGNMLFGNDPITGALPFDLLFPGFAPNPVAIDDLNNGFNDLFAAIPAPQAPTGTVPVVPIQDTTAGGNAGGDAAVPIDSEEVDDLLDWYINLDDETFAQIQANLRASGFNFEGEQ